MSSSSQRRKIIFFTTAAGTGLSSGTGQTHGGGTHIPFPSWAKHWGIMIGSGEDDADATMFELQKGSAFKELVKGHGFRADIWPVVRSRAERQQEEHNESLLKFESLGLTTVLNDEQILKKGMFVLLHCRGCSVDVRIAQDACHQMGGGYDVRYNNCQTMVENLISAIKYEDKDFNKRDLLYVTV